MYTQDNTEAAIRRIQDYLYEIHLYENKNYFAARNGIYTDATEKAVLDFQKQKNLPTTGVVDLYTFEKMRETYWEYRRKNEAEDYLYTQRGYPLQQGMRGTDVEALHTLLRALSEYDTNFPPIPRSSYFSQETENAIRYLQRMFRIKEDGIVDAILFARMENELAARIAFHTNL